MNQRSPRRKRKFRLAAFVARKIEEHAKLSRDALKIALVLTFIFVALMTANAFYEAWKDLRPASIPAVKSAP